jgi:ribosome biogenesis GTPase A
MDIQWYPGHMAKTRSMIKKYIKLIDVIIELTDARAPFSTRIPDLQELTGSKQRIAVLNKADLADRSVTKKWLSQFDNEHISAIEVNTIKRQGIQELIDLVKNTTNKSRGPVRGMVVGVPNVGKSSIINQLAGRKGAKTGDIPGITKGKMWLKVDRNLELLDMPGILWPKFEKKSTGVKLALLGCIKEELLNIYELSLLLINFLLVKYQENLLSRYKIEKASKPSKILEQIGQNRGFLLSGGKVDVDRSAYTLIREFRQGKLGKISLESPDEEDLWEYILNKT